jgi:uncharacterized protein
MNLLTCEDRNAVLARMVSVAREQKLGRTQLMKLLYFLQTLEEVPLGYRFTLFSYGPFDQEVLSDLATATMLNTLKERTVIYPRSYGYEITPGESAAQLSAELERTNGDLAKKIDAVVENFGKYLAGELELRSTIVFVDKEFQGEGVRKTASDLAERVHGIKPHFDDTTILSRVNELKTGGWLGSVS